MWKHLSFHAGVTASTLIVFTLTQENLAWRSFASLSNVYSRRRCHLEVNHREKVMSTENERGVKDKKKNLSLNISGLQSEDSFINFFFLFFVSFSYYCFVYMFEIK